MTLDTDIAASLPKNNTIISDALEIFKNHPIQNKIAIDVCLQKEDPDVLVECGKMIEDKLNDSNLFKSVGIKDVGNLVPDLMFHVLNNLPVMFTEKELDEKVRPMLEPGGVHRKLKKNYLKLIDMEGIGQGEFIARDPLGLKDIVLAKLSHMNPSQNARIYKGSLISSDGRHLLVMAQSKSSGTDTAFARMATELINDITDEVNLKYAAAGHRVSLTPVGAYRAALDNELIVRRDVKIAILLATTGIALLLLFAFPRPLIGLLSLLPALAGTAIALFVCSLLYKSISVMVLGFGGAIISITVDHGIAYLLFLDRPHETRGKAAAKEVWAIGLLAVLTTTGAFLTLCLSGFPFLEQLGLFTALGVIFSFIFVHTVFPSIFPVLSPGSSRVLPLQNVVNKFSLTGKKGACVAITFAFIMVFFAKPELNVDLRTMNTMSRDTIAADKLFSEVWGDISSKIYFMTEGADVRDLQKKGDRLLEMMDPDLLSGSIASAFVPAMIFPGQDRSKQNHAAWKKFWDDKRISALKSALKKASLDFGFAADAFEPFMATLGSAGDEPAEMDIPGKYLDLIGISKKPDESSWVQFSELTAGKSYDAEGLYKKYSPFSKIFDPVLFSDKLGSLLFSTFLKMLTIIGVSVILLLLIFFLNWKLTLVSLIPVLFSFTCTLGSLRLSGHSLDIAALMLSIIVMGMGIDYSLFFVRSYQRYGNRSHPSFGLIRMAVFMSSMSTIIGFGVLCSAEHSLLRSAGLTVLFGIGYALMGTFVILPPLLDYLFRNRKEEDQGYTGDPNVGVLRRYKNMEAYPRLFARFKINSDPMLPELSLLLESWSKTRTLIDIGSGYGVPAAWCLERFRQAKVYGIEPDHERVRVASMAVGRRGVIEQGRAPKIPAVPEPADAALMLDVIQYLSDEDLKLTLKGLLSSLCCEGRLVIRVAVPPEKHFSWLRRADNIRLKLSGIPVYYRSAEKIGDAITKAGFRIETASQSDFNKEIFWFTAKA